MTKPRHPGRTPAQRRVLDAIGRGDFSPMMSDAVRKRMLAEGLIVETAARVAKIPGLAAAVVVVREFDMPVSVHMAWCAAMAAERDDGDMAL